MNIKNYYLIIIIDMEDKYVNGYIRIGTCIIFYQLKKKIFETDAEL